MAWDDCVLCCSLSYLAAFAAGAVVVWLLATRLSIFQRIFFYKTVEGGFEFVYREFQGDYKNVSGVFAEVDRALADCDMLHLAEGPVGIYFDNPSTTAKGKCRAHAGVRVRTADMTKEARAVFAANNLHVCHLPEVECLVTDFPFPSRLALIVAILRVYPAAHANPEITFAGAPMEIYTCCSGPQNRVRFCFPTAAFPPSHPGPLSG
eukprot:m.215407 g.215407  ORF g.215407 m.215407 type:complete len:207 (-) comp41108_c0_seq1:113-733(-)